MRRALCLLVLLLLPAEPASARQEVPVLDPSGPAARAEAARQANRPGEAIALYREALASSPAWAEGWFHLGTLLYSRDDCAGAEAAFGKAIALRPEAGSGWAMLGLCEFQLRKYDESLSSLQKAGELGVDPQLRHVIAYHEGRLLIGRDEFERAQEVLGSLAADGVEDEALLVALGRSVLRVGGVESPADRQVRRMLLAAGRAEHLAARKQFDEAEREYGRLTGEFSDVRNVHYALGRYFAATAQPDKAVAAYERELARFADHVPALIGIAAIKAETQPSAALPYAEQAVRLNPRVPLGRYVLGSLLLRTGDIDRAIVELETAERSVREDPGLYYALSRAYSRAGREADAERAQAEFTRLTEARQDAARRQPEPPNADQR